MSGPTTCGELRELQRPIKRRFAGDPEAAQITLDAEGSLDEGISCSVQTLQRLTERYRVVFRTLTGSPSPSVSLERN